MTMLVSVSNFVMLYVFWEAVGLCSYLLVGFWFEKPSAAAAGMKAMLVNRVGDFGFSLGVFLIWTTFGTFDFHDSKVVAASRRRGPARCTLIPWTLRTHNCPGTLEHGISVNGGRSTPTRKKRKRSVITAICLLLLVGACGKGTIPAARLAARRHGRPDARQRADPRGHDGHCRRLHGCPLHAALPCLGNPSSRWPCIGGFTALMAAAIALTQFDLKRCWPIRPSASSDTCSSASARASAWA